jgi:4-hydroxybenzoate polyprenyltransferase
VTASLPRRFATLVRLEHTVFALPFAYVGAFLAVDGSPGWSALLWISVAMVGARTLAMGLNRIVDAGIDARNPRTASRELPAGTLTSRQVWALCAAAFAIYLVAVFQLDPVVRWLSPIPVALFVLYPYLKRFTWLCHVWLGVCTGLAPLGAWIAVTGQAPWEAWALFAAQGLWVWRPLHARTEPIVRAASWATRFGERGVRRRPCFHRSRRVLAAAGAGLSAGFFYWAGLAVVAALLLYEHSIVRPGDLRRLDAAFFTVNGVISVAFFAFVVLDTVA